MPCGVGCSVAAAVAVGECIRSWRDGGDSAQVGEGGFGVEPVRVVASGDQQLIGDLDANAGAPTGRRPPELVDNLKDRRRWTGGHGSRSR